MNTPRGLCPPAKLRSLFPVASLLAGLGLFAPTTPPLRAAEPLQPGQWWGTIELGAGQLHRTTPGFSNNSGRFYLGLAGGIAVDPHVLLGAEFSGWLIQAEDVNDPTKGSGISRVFAVARIYPQSTSTLHFQIGAGSITGWDKSPSSSYRHGTGWEAGVGYDAVVGTRGVITPFLRYSSGKAGNLTLSAVTIGVGYTWR